MIRNRTVAFGAVAIAAAIWCGPPAGWAQGAPSLSFCAAEHNAPMSSASTREGIEIDVARELAFRLGHTPRFVWLDPHREILEEAVATGECDVALGTLADPGTMAHGITPSGVARSDPYYQQGYVLIGRPGGPAVRVLADLDDRIAVEVESVPIYTLKQRGHSVFAVNDATGVIQSVARGDVAHGYLWGPLAYRLLEDRADVEIVEQYVPEDRWSFALAVKEDRKALLAELNSALGQLGDEGVVTRIFSDHGMRFMPPVQPTGGPAS